VRDLVAGTVAVEGGNLDTEVRVTSDDEVSRLTGSFNHMVGELRLKERIKDTFGKYMDPRIVANLLDNPDIADLGGERREMTVMFIDLKGFTSIAEVLASDDLVRMINRFFGHMTDAISENQGVVDKFMGDAVMAFWGPPFTAADAHAGLACAAAVQALDRLELFRRDIRDELGDKADGLNIDLRIGISTGEMIVGTVGSRVSMSFTIMGDPVNLGARLEGANKAYGTRALISERTRELAGDAIAVRELDLIRVKGKREPTRVFELLSLGHDQPALAGPKCQHFPSGLAAYRRQAWDHATTAFNACLKHNPDDPPAAVYLDRITQLRAKPLPADWDGVWEFQTK
jgi:adenylate cyclase